MRRKKTPALGLLLVILSSLEYLLEFGTTLQLRGENTSLGKHSMTRKNTGVREMQSMHSGVLKFHHINSGGRDKYENLAILAKASRAINHYSVLEFQEKLALNAKSSTQGILDSG